MRTTSPSSARPSCAASSTRRPLSGGTASSPRYPATGIRSCFETVWVDESYVNDTDLSKGYRQARKRGLSRQSLCICVANDIHKNPVAVACGHGKPSSARMRKAVGGRIAPGSLLIHGLERAHGVLAGDCGLENEAHRVATTRSTWSGWRWRTTCAPGSSDTFGTPRGCGRGTCRPTSTGTSTSFGSTRHATDGPDCESSAPYPDGRHDLPQLGVGAASPVICTIRLI